MGLSHIAVIAAISLSGLWPSSCSKAPVSSQRARSAVTNVVAVAKPSKTMDLGVIQLTNHCETEIDLGKGAGCAITPQLLDHHNLQLTLSLGSKSANGRPTRFCITRVNAKLDLPFNIT